MSDIIVGVTGINAQDNPGPGIGVARSLKEAPELRATVVGLTYDALEPGNYMPWIIDRSFNIPYPSSDGEVQLARLRDIRRRHGLDCVIPNLDAELPFYIRYADQLASEGIRVLAPTMDQFRLRGKDRLTTLADNIGLACPRTRVIHSLEELPAATEQLGWPLIVKGVYYEALRAFTLPQARAHADRLAATWGWPIILQEVECGDELNVVAVGDGRGGLLGRVAMKKTAITALGKAWGAVTVENEAMLAATARFASAYRWRGPFELECIVSDDVVHLVEINPRFPAWVYFATGVGVNLPARLIKRLLGADVADSSDYASGRMFVRYAYELVTDMTRFEQLLTRGETL